MRADFQPGSSGDIPPTIRWMKLATAPRAYCVSMRQNRSLRTRWRDSAHMIEAAKRIELINRLDMDDPSRIKRETYDVISPGLIDPSGSIESHLSH